MRCDECQLLITDALYGEIDEKSQREFSDHLASCRACSDTYEQMQAALRVMDRRERPDPGQAFWEGYWNRLQARLEREGVEHKRGWLERLFPGFTGAWRKWAYLGGVAVVLVVLGAVAGRVFLPGPAVKVQDVRVADKPTKGGEPAGQAPTVEACARQYLEDSQVLLLALVNFDPETEAEYLSDLSPEKKRSRELLAQAASLKYELTSPKQRRLKALVSELELILLQIANLESGEDLDAVDLIRSSVSDRGVMLKIDMEKMRGGELPEPKPGACDV